MHASGIEDKRNVHTERSQSEKHDSFCKGYWLRRKASKALTARADLCKRVSLSTRFIQEGLNSEG